MEYLARHLHVRHPGERETTLSLVRHGQTRSNVEQRLAGWTDVPLDEVGLQQAALIAERISESDDVIDAIVSSPLQRALVTARAIGERIGSEPILDESLKEMHFGDLENWLVDRLLDDFPDLLERFADLEDQEVGWPGGETRREFHKRVLDSFVALMHRYEDQHIVVVTHGGVISSFLAQVEGQNPYNFNAYTIQNTSLSQVRVTSTHSDILLMNDVVHLEVLSASPPEPADILTSGVMEGVDER